MKKIILCIIVPLLIITIIMLGFFSDGIRSYLSGWFGNGTGTIDAKKVFTEPKLIELANACQKGDVAKIKQAVESGADINAKGSQGISPIVFCFLSDNIAGLETMLSLGANPNIQQEDGNTPLGWAIHKGRIEFVSLLIKFKALVNKRAINNESPLGMANSRNQLKIVELLLSSGADANTIDEGAPNIINAFDRNGPKMTLLFLKFNADFKIPDGVGNTLMKGLCVDKELYANHPQSNEFKILWDTLKHKGAVFPCEESIISSEHSD